MPPNPEQEKVIVCDILHTKRTGESESDPLLSGHRRPPNTYCSCRYIVAYMAFLAWTCGYLNRVNISVAITAMTNSSFSGTVDFGNTSSAETCPERSSDGVDEIDTTGEFNWDSHTQEQILAAFYYGFPVFMIPAGLIVDKHPRACTLFIGVGFLMSHISNIFIPLAARSGGVPAIMALRVISGISESGCYPSVYSLMSRWAPKADRSTLLAIIFAGASAGQIIAQPISGILAETDFLGGWPSSFYIFGFLGMLWFIPWVLLVYPTPLQHPRISAEERDYIAAELQLEAKRPKKYPWKEFFTSMPLVAVCVTDFALLWVLYALTSNLPIFLTEVLRFDITTAGILSSIPHIVFCFFIIIGGVIADYLLAHTSWSITAIRKFMTTIGILPSGVFLLLVGYVGCNAGLSITCISLGLACSGLAYSGSSLTMMEFATPYAGMVVAIATAFATIPGFIAPLVVAIYTENQADISGWRTFFWITFGIAVVAWLIFMIFGTSELQPWAKDVEEEDDDEDEKKTIKSQGASYGGIEGQKSYEGSAEKESLLPLSREYTN